MKTWAEKIKTFDYLMGKVKRNKSLVKICEDRTKEYSGNLMKTFMSKREWHRFNYYLKVWRRILSENDELVYKCEQLLSEIKK